MLYAYRTRLTKFDLDNDGYLDGSEIAMAFQAYEEKMQSIETGAVPFAFFPPEVQQNLTRYDESGDRMLDGMLVATLHPMCFALCLSFFRLPRPHPLVFSRCPSGRNTNNLQK